MSAQNSYIARVLVWFVFSLFWFTACSPRNRAGLSFETRLTDAVLPWRYIMDMGACDGIIALYIKHRSLQTIRGKSRDVMSRSYRFLSRNTTPSVISISNNLEYLTAKTESVDHGFIHWSESMECYILPSGTCLKVPGGFNVTDVVEVDESINPRIAVIEFSRDLAYPCLRVYDTSSGQCLSSMRSPANAERIFYDNPAKSLVAFDFSERDPSAYLFKYENGTLRLYGRLSLSFFMESDAWLIQRKGITDGYLVFVKLTTDGRATSAGVALLSRELVGHTLHIGETVSLTESPGILRIEKSQFHELTDFFDDNKCYCD